VFTWFGELDRQEPEYHIHPYQNWVELFGIGSRTRFKIYIFEESKLGIGFPVPFMCGAETKTGAKIFGKEN
jgi:hypothetical protein